jgi:prepilin-type N-terminal cleavage/methylation domain-containing protein
MIKSTNVQAFSLLEIIIAVSIFGLVLVSSGAYSGFSLVSLVEQNSYSQASALAHEARTVIKVIADNNWSDLNLHQSGLSYNGQQWSLLGENSTETIDRFSRQLEFISLCRDDKKMLVDCSPGTVDEGSKRVIIKISWSAWYGQRQLKYDTYVSDYR